MGDSAALFITKNDIWRRLVGISDRMTPAVLALHSSKLFIALFYFKDRSPTHWKVQSILHVSVIERDGRVGVISVQRLRSPESIRIDVICPVFQFDIFSGAEPILKKPLVRIFCGRAERYDLFAYRAGEKKDFVWLT